MPPAPDTGTLNYCWSQALIGGLVAAGVRQAVISPGSRSTPLALAMLRQPGLACEIILDERCAAFFALGAARASRQPVVILATSGSAVANWLPAVIEANLAGVPLILLSADRPAELQGVGANQTMPQAGLFGPHVRACHALSTPTAGFDPAYLAALAARSVEQATWPEPGPVHINQPFCEPLVPSTAELPASNVPRISVAQPSSAPDRQAIQQLAGAISGQPGLIVCGEMPAENGLTDTLSTLAGRLGCPVLVEPLSNLRFGPHDRSHLLVRYNDWLGQPAATTEKPAWLLRFGAFPVTRNLQNLVGQQYEVLALADPWPRWRDPSHRLTHLLRASPLAVCRALLDERPKPAPATWLSTWQAREIAAGTAPTDPHAQLIGPFLAALPAGHPVFVGNSLAIRLLDSHAGSGEKPLEFFANRGASGIDGNISSALGIASVRGKVVALLGDLTCQHDIGGLAAARGRDAVIVTVNNGGGGIFKHLPQAGLPEFERAWLTPQQIDFQQAAGTFGLAFSRASDAPTLKDALQQAIAAGGPHLIEVTL